MPGFIYPHFGFILKLGNAISQKRSPLQLGKKTTIFFATMNLKENPRDRSTMPKQPKPCELCQQLATIRYRIQFDESDCWWLVCPQCQQQRSQDNPHYRYGGTWKAK